MCQQISSVVIFITNILIAVIGLALLTFGALLHWGRSILVDKIVPLIVAKGSPEEPAKELVNEFIKLFGSSGLAVFIFGIILFVVAFCAVCGVCMKNRLLLGIYASVVLLILLALIIVTIVFGTRRNWIKDQFGNFLKEFIVENYKKDDSNDSKTQFIDALQRTNQCCGSINGSDYFAIMQNKVPTSCCKPDTACENNANADNSWIGTGCNKFMWKQIDLYYSYILYCLIGLVLVCFLFAVIAIYLLSRYTREEGMKMV